MRRLLMLTAMLAAMGLCGCGGGSEPAPVAAKPADGLPQAVKGFLAGLRRPKPGEFATPVSPVRHLIEQVRRRDFDEATKAFPVQERFERVSFIDAAQTLSVYSATATPLPGAPYQRLLWASGGLESYDLLTMALLGVAPTLAHSMEGKDLAAQARAAAEKLDPGRLKDLAVVEADRPRAVPVQPHDAGRRALGVEAMSSGQLLIRSGENRVECLYLTARIDGNWRILTLVIELAKKP